MATTAQDQERRFHRADDTPESVAGRTRFVVTPIAAPSILGLFGFAGGMGPGGVWHGGAVALRSPRGAAPAGLGATTG